MTDISLITGAVPVVVLVAGGIALLVLLARRGRLALVTVVVAVAVAAVALPGARLAGDPGADLFPEALPDPVTPGSPSRRRRGPGGRQPRRHTVGRKVLALGSGLVVLVAAGSQINIYFAEYPTLGALTGREAEVSPLTGTAQRPSQAVATPVVDRWTGPATGTSQVVTAPIPGTVSGFTARDAYIYLPAGVHEPVAAAAARPDPGVRAAGRPAGLDHRREPADPARPVRRRERRPRPGRRSSSTPTARTTPSRCAWTRTSPRPTPTSRRTCPTGSPPSSASTRTTRTGRSAASPTAAPARSRWRPGTRTSTRRSSTSPVSASRPSARTARRPSRPRSAGTPPRSTP